MSENRDYDIVVIGSGISALTLAGIMAQVNKKRVLILERHSRIGGYTHSFSRKKYTWDVGLHYIGTIFEGRLTGKVFNFITGGRMKWRKIPEPFEHFVYPDFTFRMYGEEKKFRDDLVAMFPDEKKAISSYLFDTKIVTLWFRLYFLCQFLPLFLRLPLAVINIPFRKKALNTTAEYLDGRFNSPKLKSILGSQWGNYGLPPSQSAFMIHGLVVTHFINGGYYPEGGSVEIARSILPAIENSGGRCLVNHEVTGVIVENGRAVGVAVKATNATDSSVEKYYAPVIVSGAGAFNTYTKLMPESHDVPFVKNWVSTARPSSCVALYVGLNGDVKSVGFTGANHWLYDGYDHEKHFSGRSLLDGKPSACFVSFTLPNDAATGPPTAVIISYANHEEFEKWQHQASGRRDGDYYALKDLIAQGLIDFVEQRYPGFAGMVDYMELATPLTTEDFTANPDGAMYGLPATPERYRQKWLRITTPLRGFYMTGTDVAALGVITSMMAGFATAAHLNGPFGFFKLIRRIQRSQRKVSSGE
ncbi:MAG: NAD(P)/FAD-dependent oxidoreductase [Chitinispirillaceae bacterium]|nr:NAD(P)/FAD-dependent oxidoreductase [Chitinispirillaceae bacterium]